MLVLSRKVGESLMIGDGIEVSILELTSDVVKIGIQAPKEVGILRKELYVSVEKTNKSAEGTALSEADLLTQFGEMRKNKK